MTFGVSTLNLHILSVNYSNSILSEQLSNLSTDQTAKVQSKELKLWISQRALILTITTKAASKYRMNFSHHCLNSVEKLVLICFQATRGVNLPILWRACHKVLEWFLNKDKKMI